MKKTLPILLVCLLAGTFFTGCPQEPAEETAKHVAKTVDLRNKDAAGKAVARSVTRASDVEFSYKLLTELSNFEGSKNENANKISYVYWGENGKEKDTAYDKGENFTMLADAISFEDCEEGVKFVFKKPADYDNLNYLLLQYVDNNGQRSTCVEAADTDSLYSKGDFELVFPLVIAGQKANFWIQTGNGNDAQPDVYFFYEVMPAHGTAKVDDLQYDYEETDYVNITEGYNMNIVKVIPTKTKKGNLQHYVKLFEQNGDGPAYSADRNTLYEITEAATESEITASNNGTEIEYTFDLRTLAEKGVKLKEPKGYSHIFTEFWYKYTLDALPGYVFSTPAIKPVPVENTYFKK